MSADVVVRGGEGGTVAMLAHLRRAAVVLRAAADRLEDAASAVRWVHARGLGVPDPGSAVDGRARDAVAALAAGPSSLRAQAEVVRHLSRTVRRAAETYEDADGRAADVLRVLLAVVGDRAGQAPVVAALGALVTVRVLAPGVLMGGAVMVAGGRRLQLRTDAAEPVLQLLTGVARGLGPGADGARPVPVVDAARGLVLGTGAAGRLVPSLRRRPLRVTARLEAVRPGPAPAGAADLLAGVGALYPRSGGTPGTVGVARLDHRDGSRGWVVSIPGTQEATSFGGAANPLDMATNVRLMAGSVNDSTELVTRALQQAGARVGEPVLLAGHSQGGMVAMALTGSASFTARHRVTAVLTAGSPVATQPVPPRTAALHLEHRQDLVPALDGWRNPDAPHRTTAVRDLGASPAVVDRLAARSPGAAHEVGAYARTAAAVSAVGGPSVRGWERAAAEVLGGPGTTAVYLEFTGERAAVRRPGDHLAPPGPGDRATRRGPGLVPGPDDLRVPDPGTGTRRVSAPGSRR